jgi:hypothetical protein
MIRKISRQSIVGSLVSTVVCLCLLLVVGAARQTTAQTDKEKVILRGSELTEGFDMGVDSSERERTWVTQDPEYMRMAFPANQKWAAVFITIGEPVDKDRPEMDFSAYKTLSIDMKGQVGGEKVDIGLKTNTQPDNGREKKLTRTLSPVWETYTFPLADFKGTDIRHLYVVTEFVYNGKTPQVVYFRNIKYLK